MPNSGRLHDNSYWFMGILSALFGWLIAIGNKLQWQIPVETGQVLAGLVHYPVGNPFLCYHLHIWSLLNQLTAVALSAGVPEQSASIVIEGAVGAASFFAIFLICYAISNNRYLSLLVPLFMYSFTLTGLDIAYPIALLGTDSTFGIFGLALMLLVMGLMGNGFHRTAAFLAALAPACHPGMGAFCVLLFFASVWLNWRTMKQQAIHLFLFFAAGSIITLISLAWQYNLAAQLPGLSSSVKKVYLDAFIQNVDYHRTQGRWTHPGVFAGILSAALSGLAVRSEHLPTGARIIFTSIVASVVLTLSLVFLSDFISPFEFLRILIPWRFMNYANVCVIPLSFGLLASAYAVRPPLSRALLIASITLSILWRECRVPHVEILYMTVLAIAVCTLLIKPNAGSSDSGKPIALHDIFMILVMLFLSYEQVLPAIHALTTHKAVLTDRTNSTLYRTISARPGLLLTAGSLDRIQVRTRRPVLLDGGSLDTLPYSLDAAPLFHRILKQVYGIDMFVKPPENVVRFAAITFSHQALWEHRPPGDWRAIRREFGVTDILTPDSWNLQLPVIARESGLTLFTIP